MLKSLTKFQKRLLASFFLFGLAAPMVVVYANTFLWRQSADVVVLAIFNIGNYAGISLGFLFNAYLLRFFESGKLYALGCLLQGVVPILMVAMGAQADTYALGLGFILGIAQGFFWGNRNALTSKFTQGPQRYQFISVETAIGILAGVISPLLIGWFIAFGETLPTYTVDQAYQITSVIGFVLLLISGFLAWPFAMEPFTPKHFFLTKASSLWNKQRLVEGVNGIASGIESVLPLVIILLFLGQEEAVGSVKAMTAILSAVAIYAIGKRVRHNHHALLFSLWILLNLTGGIIFAIFYSPGAALTLFILGGLVGSLRWSSFAAVMYEIVDKETGREGSHRFLYLLDREFFLNAGRVLGLGLLVLVYWYSPEALIRFGPIGIALVQIPTLLLLHNLTKNISHSA
ncbi:MAG: MFS transporter [Patescibacteria group bacterium]